MMDRVWITKQGEHIPVSKMTTSHITNCIRKIQRSGSRWRGEYLDRLLLELEIRSIRGKS